jgi:hypothetical protein
MKRRPTFGVLVVFALVSTTLTLGLVGPSRAATSTTYGPDDASYAAYYGDPSNQATWMPFCNGAGDGATYSGYEVLGVPACGPTPSNGTVQIDIGPGSPLGGPSGPGFQCVEFAERYLWVHSALAPLNSTNGGALVNNYATKYGLTVVKNGAHEAPPVGAVMSFASNSSFSAPDSDPGHVAVVSADTVNASTGNGKITIIGENQNTSPGGYTDGEATMTVNNWQITSFDSHTHIEWVVAPPPTVSKAWTPAEEPLPPGGVKLVPSSDLPFDNLSCAGAGFCAAIGVYADNDGNEHGLLEVLSDGVWTATKAPVPANGGPSGDPLLWGVSCAQVGFCVAVGGYTGSNRRMSGLIETLAGGKWIATEAPLPARASWSNGLAAVSCVGDDYCVAGGGYSTSDGFDEGLLETLSGDVWTASEAPLPANAIGVPDTSSISMGLQLVSCGSARSCAAVGWYKTSDLPNAIVLETLSGGVWTATQATLPANIRAVFNFAMTSISCSQAGLCVAVGFYDHSDGEGADVIETLSGGIWTFGIAPKPANPEPGELPVLYSVSCAASGFCAAVGQGFIETLAGGLWTVSEASPPSNPDGSSATVSGLQSVSCARPGSCVAVGEYGSPNRPLGGLIELLADGKWTATEASLPANGGKRGESRLDAASCGEVESCVALGDYSVGERTEGLIDAG